MKVILLVGVPCSGKTWIANQVKDKYAFVPHDAYPRNVYLKALLEASRGDKVVLAEAPFNASSLASALRERGVPVEEWLVTADPDVIEARYWMRTKRLYPANFRTNHTRYESARERFRFTGTSDEIVKLL